ncbi:hypothetical protein FACS1894116_04660 [Betaproteobacteria bacterium]|nr:hypothetical protein FACS1894116_04660 [Betaproteobacteria bacterium]GHT97619.1 hypothetical protein FACS1894154_01370 [Betaproteobacteria bacterium]GHU28301.1 hypothetical protein FACS189497_03420 [Betaproteobacteria bacterium]
MIQKKISQFVVDNLRLKELAAIVEQNKPFYDAFSSFLQRHGYANVAAFIHDTDSAKARSVIESYLANPAGATLHDGLGRPYTNGKAKWYFLAWILRDAPAQRLEPLLRSIDGATLEEKKVVLINHLREFVGPLFPGSEKWTWPIVSEIMLARLEGSRRALRGTRFESLVRNLLTELFTASAIDLAVGEQQITISDETYDVQVVSGKSKILMPVKTRETMGGGHANLFTRDIHKTISVAQENGYLCIPIVIAESWGGDLDSLHCEHLIYIQANPNQTDEIGPKLATELKSLLPVWRNFSEET